MNAPSHTGPAPARQGAEEGVREHIRHPAQGRGKVSGVLLFIGLLAAPLAWALLELIGWGIAAQTCSMRLTRMQAQLTHGDQPAFVILLVAALAVALIGFVCAVIAWQRTRSETHGDGPRAVQLGEGRTRFLGLCGMLTSAGLALALVFNAIQMWGAPLCGV